jgi:hypothetical protein
MLMHYVCSSNFLTPSSSPSVLTDDVSSDSSSLQSEERLSEVMKHGLAFAELSLKAPLEHACSAIRMSYSCPNKRLCRDCFSRSTLEKVILQVRTSVWGSEEGVNRDSIHVGRRKNRLLADLTNLLVEKTDGSCHIEYRLNGKPVCKCFYKVIVRYVILL